MNYEKLNLQDHVDIWDAAKVEHLEDGIVAAQEAIKQYHENGSTEGGVQADWRQSDPTAADYVKNKTHYKDATVNILWDNAEATNEPYYYGDEIDGWDLIYPKQAMSIDPDKIDLSEPAIITINGITKEVYVTIIEADFNNPYYLQYRWQYDDDYYFCMYPNRDKDSSDYGKIWVGAPVWKMEKYEKFTFSFSITTAIYHTLNEAYIPNTVVRHFDLQQSDWNIDDENDIRYIKNKTHGTVKGKGDAICSVGYKGESGQHPYICTSYYDMDADHGWMGNLIFYVGTTNKSYRINANSNWEWEEMTETFYWTPDEFDYAAPWVRVKKESIGPERYKLTFTIGGDLAENIYYLWPEVTIYEKLNEQYLPDFIEKYQSDYNEEDENKTSYIKNRPCYTTKEKTSEVFTATFNGNNYNSTESFGWHHWYRSPEAYVIINNNKEGPYSVQFSTANEGLLRSYYIKSPSCTINMRYDSDVEEYFTQITMHKNLNSDNVIQILELVEKSQVIPLDEKYLPNTVVKKQDLNTLNWSSFGETEFTAQTCLNALSVDIRNSLDGISGTALIKDVPHSIYLVSDDDNVYGTYTFIPDENFEFTVIPDTLYGIYDPIDNTYTFTFADDIASYIAPPIMPEEPEVEEPEVIDKHKFSIIKIYRNSGTIIHTIDNKYIPDTIARAPKATLENVTEAPTAEQYNALLNILREAGILA